MNPPKEWDKAINSQTQISLAPDDLKGTLSPPRQKIVFASGLVSEISRTAHWILLCNVSTLISLSERKRGAAVVGAKTRSDGVTADKTPFLMRHIRSDHFKSLLIMYLRVRSLRRLLKALIYLFRGRAYSWKSTAASGLIKWCVWWRLTASPFYYVIQGTLSVMG